MVTSSWVGPTPPEVNTTSWAALCSRTSVAMRSTSSGITEMRRTSTPNPRSSRHRYAALASAILPDRISLPMRTMPAVFAMAPNGSTAPCGVRMAAEMASPTVEPVRLSGWALVLGASSGFGEASSLALARAGVNVFGVHLDRRATLPNVERIVREIRAMGRGAHFFKVNAADDEKRVEVATEMERILRERGELGALRVLLHSLAFGTLKLFIADPMKEAVTKAQMDMTLDVMAHSLI